MDSKKCETKPLVHLNAEEVDDVYRARTRLRGCVRLLSDLYAREDEADSYTDEGVMGRAAAFDVLIENLHEVSNSLDHVFDLTLSQRRRDDALRWADTAQAIGIPTRAAPRPRRGRRDSSLTTAAPPGPAGCVMKPEGRNDDVLRLVVLRAIGARGAAMSGYSRPDIEGYSRGQIDAAVAELKRGGFVDAAWIPQAFGDNPAHWEPSVLTVPGRHLLEELEGRRSAS
jgi:hypothetical protein